jgi:hypothetical protein
MHEMLLFHHSIIPGWDMQNGWLGIPYYQQFVEIPIHQITRNPKSETNSTDRNLNEQNKNFNSEQFGAFVLNFEHLNFRFVSDFDIRILAFDKSYFFIYIIV